MIGVLSRFIYNPKTLHLKAANHVLRYIKGALDFDIFYEKHTSPTVVDYTNLDWRNCRLDRKSVTSWIFKLAGGPISWSSMKQQIVAILSMDPKAKALSEGIREVIWLGILSTKIHGFTLDPIAIFCNN